MRPADTSPIPKRQKVCRSPKFCAERSEREAGRKPQPRARESAGETPALPGGSAEPRLTMLTAYRFAPTGFTSQLSALSSQLIPQASQRVIQRFTPGVRRVRLY